VRIYRVGPDKDLPVVTVYCGEIYNRQPTVAEVDLGARVFINHRGCETELSFYAVTLVRGTMYCEMHVECAFVMEGMNFGR
jgi:hypothetical protein